MDARIYSTPILVFLIFVLPFVGAWPLFWSWPVLVSLSVGIFLFISQPPISAEDLGKKDAHDKRSVLLLMITGCLVFLVPVLDYRFGCQSRPPIEACWSIVGLALTFGGILFRYWSIRTLGKFFTSVVKVQTGQRVIQHGPYRFLRHPSYTGSFVMALGISVLFRSYVGLAFVLIGFFGAYIYRITAEEKTMLAEFGDEYAAFQKRTWRMLPPIY